MTNAAGASITGGSYGIFADGGVADVTNSGSITGTSGYGIRGRNDAVVSNNAGASIAGTYGIRVDFGFANVTNSGSITGTSFAGILANSDATVINSTGVISGTQHGILAGTFANVTNSGSITGTSDTGIYAGFSATVVNSAGASISGGQYGIFVQNNGGSSVFNAGTIGGGTAAIRFAGSGNALTLAQGSVINGNVLGTGSDTFQLGGTGVATFYVSTLGPAAQYRGFGTFNKIDSSVWTLTGTPAQSTSWSINGGTLSVSSNANLGSGAEALSFNGGILRVTGTTFTLTPRAINWGASGGGFDIADGDNTFTVAQAIGPGGALTKLGAGTLVLSGLNTYTGGTNIDAGTLSFSADANLGAASGSLTFTAGILQYTGGSDILSAGRNVTLNGGGGTFDIVNGAPFTVLSISSSIGGSGGLTKTGAGTLALGGTNSYGGATNINAGRLDVSNGNAIPNSSAVTVAGGAALGLANDETIGSLAGAGSVLGPIAGGSVTLTTGADNTSTSFSGVISNGTGLGLTVGLTKIGTGTQTLSGINTYTGATTVDGGILSVSGSIASSAVTVNAGGTLGGNGMVGNTTIDGGALAPGNSIGLLTVQGNLSFTAASSYMLEVSSANADRTNVTGAATLGGATVNASFATGTYVARQYTILHSNVAVSGTFAGPVNTNLPAGFRSSLSYDANNAFLNLALDFTPTPTPNFGGGLSGNQQVVGNALINFFNSTGGIPLVFGALTPAGLSQVSGEIATGSQQSTFTAMTQFMGLMLDPFTAGRGDGGAGATGFAPEGDAFNAYASTARKRSGTERDAHGMITKVAPRAPMFEARWNVWAAGFGGSQTTDGNATQGFSTATSRIYGVAAGADYWLSPQTVAGLALAGGGTNFNVANGLGSGRADLFQAGALIRHNVGAAYITAAAAYGWQDVTTDRTVTIAGIDRLRAQFNANAWSGRVEGGYRFVTPWIGGIGITPYAAAQVTAFELPAYAESVVSGANTFALSYGAKIVTATRSELGLRSDKSFAMQDGILTLRSRSAWAHDFNPDRSIAATFQTLPGATFVVNGAAQARDAALSTASAEMKWRNGWSAAATFEGEFSAVTRSYAGKGVVGYQW